MSVPRSRMAERRHFATGGNGIAANADGAALNVRRVGSGRVEQVEVALGRQDRERAIQLLQPRELHLGGIGVAAAERGVEAVEPVHPLPALGRDVAGFERVAVHAAQLSILEQAEPIGVLVDGTERLPDVGEHVDAVGRTAVHRPDELVEDLRP